MGKLTLNAYAGRPPIEAAFVPPTPSKRRRFLPLYAAIGCICLWAMTVLTLLVLQPYVLDRAEAPLPAQQTVAATQTDDSYTVRNIDIQDILASDLIHDTAGEIPTRNAVDLLQDTSLLAESVALDRSPQPAVIAATSPDEVLDYASPEAVVQKGAENADAMDEMEKDRALPECVAQLGGLISTVRIAFASGAGTPNESDMEQAREIARVLADCDLVMVAVEGHSDQTGEETANMTLSWVRAEAVINQLRAEGFDISAFEPLGFGSRKPIDASGGQIADAQNRRVQFHLAPRHGTNNKLFATN